MKDFDTELTKHILNKISKLGGGLPNDYFTKEQLTEMENKFRKKFFKNNMRQVILNRINEYKDHCSGFDARTRKWKDVKIHNVHISEVVFETIDDDMELLRIFELIVIKTHKAF